MARDSEARRRDKFSAISRELVAMSDWELERGLHHPSASITTEGMWQTASCGTDMPGRRRRVALWIMAIAAGACMMALLE